MKKQEEMLLATIPKPLTLFDYQPVFCYRQSKKYSKSVNILCKGKILKKIYLESYVEASEEMDITETIVQLFADIFTGISQNKKRKSKSATRKESDVARANAANELFETLNL
jgi:hypothetical protein